MHTNFRAHQTHYEQMGNLFGKVKLEDAVWNVQKMPSFRDHSFGIIFLCEIMHTLIYWEISKFVNPYLYEWIGTSRDWKLMHRYIFHHVFLNDGTKMVIGVVCQPHTCSK